MADTKKQVMTIEPFSRSTQITGTAFDLLDRIRRLVARERWEEVMATANLGLGLGNRAIRHLRGEMMASLQSGAQVKSSTADFKKHLMSFKNKAERKKFFNELIAKVRKGNGGSEREFIKSLEMLAAGKTKNVPSLDNMDKAMKSPEAYWFDASGETAVALLTKSLLALIHAEFNLNHYRLLARERDKKRLPLHSSNLQGLIDPFAKRLKVGQQEIYTQAMKQNLETMSRAAFSLAGKIEEELPAMAREQARHHVMLRNLVSEKKKKEWQAATKTALAAGDLVREAVASYASAYALVLETAKAVGTSGRVELAARAKSRPFAAKLPDGKNVELKDLDKHLNGKYVELHGLVIGTTAGKSGDKDLISKVGLWDPISKAKAIAAIPYAHLGHLGIARGAYCKLNGTYKAKSGLNFGKPAVEIEKLKISALSKKSWLISFLDLADKWYFRWPGGMNLQASLAPHRRKRKGGEREYEGAGEIIYQPLIRR